MKSALWTVALAAAFVPAWAGTGVAVDKPDIDEKTKEVMKKLGALYKDAKTLHTDAAIETTTEGQRAIKVKAKVAFERPNRFALRGQEGDNAESGPVIVSDGKTMFALAKRLKQYTESKAPGAPSGVARALAQPPFYPVYTGILFVNILSDDPEGTLLDGVTKGEHAGMEKVDGKEAHHLKFTQDNLDWALWVAAEGQPLILKISSEMEGPGGKMTTVEKYTNWKINAEPAKDAFTFTPPKDAEKVKTISPRGGG